MRTASRGSGRLGGQVGGWVSVYAWCVPAFSGGALRRSSCPPSAGWGPLGAWLPASACPPLLLSPPPQNPVTHSLWSREQALPELLDCAYGLLRMRYLSQAWQLLQGAASWQAAEAALYLLSAVSLGVKARVLGGASGGDENAAAASAAAVEDREQTQALLVALFGRVCSPEGGGSMLGAHPALAEATCRLLEHYSSWFGKAGEEPPLQAAFQLLLRALPIPQVCLQGRYRVAGVGLGVVKESL